MSDAPPNQTSSSAVNYSLRKYEVRHILGATLIALALFRFLMGIFDLISIAALTALIIYFCSTSYWLHIARKRKLKRHFYLQLSTIDAFICGVTLTYFYHDYALSGIILVIIAFHATILASYRQMVVDICAFFLGTGVISQAVFAEWNHNAHFLAIFIALTGAIAYLSIYAHDIYQRFNKLSLINKKVYNDLVLHKVRTYKLSRYVTPTVWSALNQGRDESLKTERKRLTVFFSDIEGFSSLSEELEAETLTDLLNTYFTEMIKIVTKHKGTIDKFMGDGLMVIFGDTNSGGVKSDCIRCVAMAVDMRKKMKELETHWFNQGIKKPLRIRMGINSGYCTVGTFGTNEYMDYTVLGTHVNLASRLESAADSGEILTSHETWSLIKDVIMCRDRGEIKAKGFSHSIKVYQILDFRKEMGRNQSYFEERVEGFSMHLDLEKIKNYDRNRIIEQLEKLADKVRDKI